MPEAVAQPEASTPGLSEVQRVVDTFVAPSKTFNDIQRSSSWWLPWLLGVLVTLAFGFAVQQKIGWNQTYDNILRNTPSQQQRMEQLTTAQQARAKQIGVDFTKYAFWSAPLTGLLMALVAAAILLGTINFGFGGRAKFSQMFAVWMYGSLPLSLKGILGIVTIYAGVDPHAFNLQNFVGSNFGYYLPQSTAKWLMAAGTSLDIFIIWTLILLTIGCAAVGKIKRGQAATAVWGWWVLIVLIRIVAASFGA